MAIPRGDCDCCLNLADRLHEIEPSYWVCTACLDCAIRCGDTGALDPVCNPCDDGLTCYCA